MVDAPDPKAVAGTVRAGLLRICEDFTVAVADRGFRQTKKRMRVRRKERTADWFGAFGSSHVLLGWSDSPLALSMKGLLRADLAGARNPDNEKLSLKLLGFR